MGQKASFSERISYQIDNLMTWQPLTKVIALFLMSALHILIGAVLYYLFVEASLDTVMWISWTYTADPGTHADEATLRGRLVSAFITLGGMLFFALFIGLITDAIGEKVDELKKGRSRVLEEGHTLILGWSDKLMPLVQQLVLANESEGGGVIVVLAEHEKADMEAAFQEDVASLGKTRVVCRTGSPFLTTDLEKVAAGAARAVVVLSESDAADSDAMAIRTVLALCQGLPKLSGHVVVELREPDNIPLVRMVGAEQVEPVVAHDMVGRLMIQCSRQPGLAQIYVSMLGFEGDEFYLQAWPALIGRPLAEVRRMFSDAVVCGLRAAGSDRVQLLPPDDRTLQAGDELLVLAEDNDSYTPSAVPADAMVGPLPDWTPPPPQVERILLCGWRRDLDTMLLELDSYVAAGSEVTILSHRPLASRDATLWKGSARPQNLRITHRVGDLDVRRDLEEAEVASFDAVLILADEDLETESKRMDSRALVSLLLIRDLQQRHGNREAPLISEICDTRTKRLVSVTDASDYVVSNELISMALSTVAEDRRINAVWMELFSADGCELYLKDARLYARPGESLSFWQISERARMRNETAIGWRSRQSGHSTLNPRDKAAARAWTDDDQLIVIAES